VKADVQPKVEVQTKIEFAPTQMKTEPASDDSLSDWLKRRAAARAMKRQKQEPTSDPALVPAMPPVAGPKFAQVFEPVAVNSSALAALAGTERPTAEPESRFEVLRGAAANSNHLAVPAGVFEESMLANLLEIRKPFTGLVISIGVSDTSGRKPQDQDLMMAARSCISGLLGEKDFASPLSKDEFVMVCPGVTGAEAQRRLSHASERLWDFQLRGIGVFSVLFSWGGIDVEDEPLFEAIHSASERMAQTRRSRKTVSVTSASDRRKAV